MVDVVITRIRFSGPKSRSVNMFPAAGFGYLQADLWRPPGRLTGRSGGAGSAQEQRKLQVACGCNNRRGRLPYP